ncbi:hypothetical protein [Pararhizobium arenae]|uniref:hypothetical protein n=1 Tax=Pararhizobium arenae TaxID=1856850 RepID=UPI000A7A410F|nr:hypothetical protein [Pararhizobium arenae]
MTSMILLPTLFFAVILPGTHSRLEKARAPMPAHFRDFTPLWAMRKQSRNFQLGDTAKIPGVANGAMMRSLKFVSDTMLKLSGAALETATQQPDIVLMRTNP